MEKRRSALRLLSALPILAAMPAAVSAAGEPRDGIDYIKVARPAPQQGPGIEVIEFFSYGCPHCHQAEPAVSKWRASLPKDVTLRRVPISFGNPQWELLAKLYLTIVSTGDFAKLDREVFAAVHEQKVPLGNDKAIMEWAAKRVADPKKFSDMYQSFGIRAMVKSSEQTGLDFGISGIPSFGVAGRYLVVAKEAKSFQDMLRVTEGVIELARKTRG